MKHLINLIEKERDQFSNEFVEWLPKNHHVWEAFEREAFKIIGAGFKHYSARTIIHVIRHHSAITQNDGAPWKISNNSSPYLARLFALVHPEFARLFTYKSTPRAEIENLQRNFSKELF